MSEYIFVYLLKFRVQVEQRLLLCRCMLSLAVVMLHFK